MSSISEIMGQQTLPTTQETLSTNSSQDSFKSTLNNFLKEANNNILEAGEMARKFANGEVSEIHDVMIASQKASVSLEMVVEIRNKLVEAYREFMRIQV